MSINSTKKLLIGTEKLLSKLARGDHKGLKLIGDYTIHMHEIIVEDTHTRYTIDMRMLRKCAQTSSVNNKSASIHNCFNFNCEDGYNCKSTKIFLQKHFDIVEECYP